MIESFAKYLAKNYVAQKGFKLGTVPEAQKLVAASDFVLTRTDRLTFEIICIIDAEANPGKQFGLSVGEVAAIAQQCAKYTGYVNKSKMPVGIYIYEVGPAPVTSEQLARLDSYKKQPEVRSVYMSGFHVDTTNKKVHVNSFLNGLFRGRLFIEKMLNAPRVSDADLEKTAAASSQVMQMKTPWVTFLLLGAMMAAFVAEQYFFVEPSSGFLSPGTRTLLALGALQEGLISQHHEYFRLLSAAFLHAGPFHLFLNCVCLYFAGLVLENMVGRRWFCGIFAVSALGGSLMSLAINLPNLISVGASGAIMGLLAAAFVCSYRVPHQAGRMHIQMRLMQILIPSLIPLASHINGQKIDYAGHFGGAISGLIMGWIILRIWPNSSPKPKGQMLVVCISCAGLLTLGYALYMIIQNYHLYVKA